MNNNRNTRASKAKETLEIIDKGYYIVDNKKTDISVEIKNSLNQTKLYSPEYFDVISLQLNEEIQKRSYDTKIIVDNCTSLEAAKNLIKTDGNAACLNFASAKNPGGGFLGGSQAQEESLTRASALYPTLMKYFNEMYEYNRSLNTYLYSDYMIYSPDVVFFKDDADKLSDKPYLLDILTSPAVNIGAMKKNRPSELALSEKTMLERMDKIFALFVLHNAENLILGAWGCGVFQNEADDVARYFAYYLKEGGKYSRCFKNIIFAIYDKNKNGKNIKPFENTF